VKPLKNRRGNADPDHDEKSGFFHPPLILRMPRVDGPSYAKLKPDDPLYSMASWVFHHGDEQPRKARRGLYIALERAWPRTRGIHKITEHRHLVAYSMHCGGSSVGDIAFAFVVQPATVRKWITETRREIDDEADTSPRIEVAVDADDPEDPASDLSYARSLVRSRSELKAVVDANARAGHPASPGASNAPQSAQSDRIRGGAKRR